MRVKDVREKNAMRAVRSLVVAVLAFVVFAAPTVVLADGRVALVVGNSNYDYIGRLPNPDNDARDMAAALWRLGFEVTTEVNADRVELTAALRRFTRRSAGADVSLVFYAGHGIEMDGVNYLVPVDARLERDIDVRFEALTLDDLLVATAGASLRLVILDACRNNPLARSIQRTAASRSVSDGSFGDLNEDLLGDETLVAYAAAAGTTAADGRGRNSPYTAALLEYLEQPLEIGLLFRRVRAQVLASTSGQQRPHEYHSLLSEHYLSVPPTADSVTVVAPPPAKPDVVPVDVEQLDVAQLRMLAEQGDPKAQTELVLRYDTGRGVRQDDDEVSRWFLHVTEQEHAVHWFRRAAEQGDASGQHFLGLLYLSGRGGVQQDDAEAVRWLRRAAEQGHVSTQVTLGIMYEQGAGVQQNYAEAARWYRLAAEQGHAAAQNRLGTMHHYGIGVVWTGILSNSAEGVRWYRLAAEQGYAYAQYNLGRNYETGRGVRRDRVEAVRWYRLAAEQGHADALKALDRLR